MVSCHSLVHLDLHMKSCRGVGVERYILADCPAKKIKGAVSTCSSNELFRNMMHLDVYMDSCRSVLVKRFSIDGCHSEEIT